MQPILFKVVQIERNGKLNRRFKVGFAEMQPILSKVVQIERNDKLNRRFKVGLSLSLPSPFAIFAIYYKEPTQCKNIHSNKSTWPHGPENHISTNIPNK